MRILFKLFDDKLNNAELNNIKKGTSNKALKSCNIRDAYSRPFIASWPNDVVFFDMGITVNVLTFVKPELERYAT